MQGSVGNGCLIYAQFRPVTGDKTSTPSIFYGLLYQMLEMTPDHHQPYAPENKDASDSDEFHQSDWLYEGEGFNQENEVHQEDEINEGDQFHHVDDLDQCC